ncbi:hypothetical protein PPL_00610 [Heterostelium album PN500]|uniref:Uncharacterized protein n=1 Tax=Heterostelium pallidum (strain ATCC 26659 / Pp 5 / PN500) TaxID=670386 RepID=D3AWY2_HETP5|nr:hypothetical protein PPL_00610 [Heterostelium album PN500]EFA86805.1 hypothetical protein PPL_00610 [Heterostelium album PN500]|eukprot:XP_020438908.1 hypothetical protein PPL_00610 [Heterostelium album PN500]
MFYNMKSYTVSTHTQGVTLINVSKLFTTKELNNIDSYRFNDTYQSMITVGKYIYLFGGLYHPNKWCKFSIKTKSISHIGVMEGIDTDLYISASYDGLDHIYSLLDFIQYPTNTADHDEGFELTEILPWSACHDDIVQRAIESDSLGGVDHGDFIYCIESKRSQPFDLDDKYRRRWCGGSFSFSINK